MPGFRDRLSRNDFFNVAAEDAFNPIVGRIRETAAAPAAAIASPGPQAFIDTVPGNTGTTAVLTVGAAPIISAIDTIADEDFYQITLIAGHDYQIGMYGYAPQNPGDPAGPTLTPLSDSYIELYDSAGTLITAADGGADTVLNSTNSGLDAVLIFTATTSGTYYVNARAFDNIPLGGDNGDLIGDYGLYAADITEDNTAYQPYYTPDSPLYAIDWGTQVNKVNQSYRNPDGDEGIRETGNDPAPIDPGAPFGHPGKNVITIYFAQAGDVFVSNDPTNPGLPPATITATGIEQFEHDAVMTALGEFEKVADIVYIEVSDRAEADFVYTSYLGTPGPGISLLGSMSPPDESDEGLAQFNSADQRWNERDLAQGGFSFVTLIHEFGHGHGMAHPHDNGGHSGIMNGVEQETPTSVADYTTGEFDLNQGVFTMMSYEDGWQTSPYGNASTTAGYGWLGGLMAFDIAVIQDKYGVNEDWAAGDDIYLMKDVNAAGTYYSAIWDVEGNDSIVYYGTRDANIDLRAASLQYEQGGGGWVSYADGIFGGFTIANSVAIERAISGSGNDTLTGNDAANLLEGGAGVDTMRAGLGHDIYFVDHAGDIAMEAAGEGIDIVYAKASYTLSEHSEIEILSAAALGDTAGMTLVGNNLDNIVYGNAGANYLAGGGGHDVLIGGGGNDAYLVDSADDIVAEGAGGGTDIVYATATYELAHNSEVEILSAASLGGTAALTLIGNNLDNIVYGNAGANVLVGGGGRDALIGGGGNDAYLVDSADDIVAEGEGEGSDIVYASASYGLGEGMAVEILSAASLVATSALSLTGNGLANLIYGNDGANLIDGRGGNDVMVGFGGADTFAFTTALGAGNVDFIDGFAAGSDKIALDDAVFAGLGLGGLGAGAFFAGGAAHDADDRIVYDSASGALYFDADGNGAGAAIHFATLQTGLNLAASDFAVI